VISMERRVNPKTKRIKGYDCMKGVVWYTEAREANMVMVVENFMFNRIFRWMCDKKFKYLTTKEDKIRGDLKVAGDAWYSNDIEPLYPLSEDSNEPENVYIFPSPPPPRNLKSHLAVSNPSVEKSNPCRSISFLSILSSC
jgi:hypothetical protein